MVFQDLVCSTSKRLKSFTFEIFEKDCSKIDKKIWIKLLKNELQNNNVCVVVQSTMMSRIVDWNKYFIIDLIIDNNNHLIMID